MDSNNPCNRRKVLKSLASCTGVLGTIGISRAKGENSGKQKYNGSAVSESRTIELTEEKSLSKSEFENYAREMEKKYGSEVAEQIVPHEVSTDSDSDGVSTMAGSSPDDTTNLTYVDAWNDKYEVRGGAPERLLATTDHALTVYRSNYTDSNDQYLYFFWHWSQAESNDPGVTYREGRLELIETGLNSDDQNQDLSDFAPSDARSVNGDYVNAGVTLGVRSFEVGITGEVWVEDGTIGPKTGSVDTGAAGQHVSELDLHTLTGKHSLNATTVIRSPFYFEDQFPPNLTWNTRVVADP